MAKIALIVPPLRANSGDYKKAAESVGVQDLASMLVAEGHKVLIIDSALEGFKNLRSDEGWTKEYGLPDEGIVWRIREFSPDLIGLSSIATSQFISLIKTAKLLKSNFPDTPIVAGGAGADGLPELTLYASRGAIDAVCIHEGYTWLSEVVKELENGLSLGDILSALIGSASLNKEGNYMQVIAITRKGQENDEEVLHAIACGASLYSLELQGLINRDIKARSYARPERNPDITATYPRTSKPTYADRQPEGTLYIDVFFSLGCPNACTFCATHSRQGSLKDECGQLRLYELDKIRDFLKQMKERGFSHLIFQDDNLTRLPKALWMEILGIASKQGFTHQHNGGLEPESLQPGDIEYMAQTGCTAAYLPINPRGGSANPTPEVEEHVVSLFVACKKNGIYTYSALILGTPGQTLRDIAADLLYARALVASGLSDYNVSYGYSCLPDTGDFDRYAEQLENNEGMRFNLTDFAAYSINTVQCATNKFSLEDFAALYLYSIGFINGKETADVYFEQGTWLREDQRTSKNEADVAAFRSMVAKVNSESVQELLKSAEEYKRSDEFQQWWQARQNRQLPEVLTQKELEELRRNERVLLLRNPSGNVQEVRAPSHVSWQRAGAKIN